MKKLLLSLVVSAAALSASAESAVFDFANPGAFGYTSDKRETGVDYNKPLVSGDVTITCDTKTAATGGGMLRFWWPKNEATATDFRCSATGGKLGQTLTFTANGGTITKIEFSAAKFALKAEPGTLGAYANKAATWEGDAKSVVFTTTDACTFNKITVTYSLGAAADLKPAGLAWSETAVTVTDDKIAEFVAPTLTNPNNLTVTYSSSDETVAKVTEAGVVSLLGKVGKATIKAAFAGNDTYRAGEATYTITVKAAPKTVASIAETIALPTKTEVVVGYELTVGWVNNNNIFVCDAAGKFIQIYGQNSYKVGDKIPAGWNATYEFYNGVTPELMPIGTLPAATEGTFTPKEVAAADVNMDLVNSVVLLKNVVFAEATPAAKSNFTGKVGETELSFRNNYEIAGVEAGKYDVTVVVTIFVDKNNNNAKSISLYVTNYAPVQSSGIEDIEVEAGEAVYYNLQGVEVANPENGIYIVRRGNKVTKEVIR